LLLQAAAGKDGSQETAEGMEAGAVLVSPPPAEPAQSAGLASGPPAAATAAAAAAAAAGPDDVIEDDLLLRFAEVTKDMETDMGQVGAGEGHAPA
jgi:hypothetical protein